MNSAQATWIAASVTALGILLFALSRRFTIEKLGAFGLEFRLHEPIENTGVRALKLPGALLFLVGILCGIYAGWLASHPPEWPKRFADLETAEVEASEVDDLMTIRVNDEEIAQITYGQTPPPFEVKKHLHKGANKIEVIIQNGRYGGCGGALTVRLNDQERQDYKWKWSEQKNMPPVEICFSQTRTLNLP